MKNTICSSLPVFMLLICLFFTNCGLYAPASTGNSSAYMARPWYDDEPAESLQVGGRINKGATYNLNEKNRFGDVEIHYARVFKNGHIAVGGGAFWGNYKVAYPQYGQLNGDKPYHGTILRGEVGVHLMPLMSSIMGGRVRSNSNYESTSGIAYSWATENGAYLKFREARFDTLNRANNNISNISQNLHTLSFFEEKRFRLENEDILGFRLTTGMTFETGSLDAVSDMQINGTLFYTHKRFTVFGQVGTSFAFNGDNKYNPRLSLGLNAQLWDFKKGK
jgi:hypothetical protein